MPLASDEPSYLHSILRFLFEAGVGRPAYAGAPAPPEERYADQLAQMGQMGFTNAHANGQALAATNGDVAAALDLLLHLHPLEQ